MPSGPESRAPPPSQREKCECYGARHWTACPRVLPAKIEMTGRSHPRPGIWRFLQQPGPAIFLIRSDQKNERRNSAFFETAHPS